jgi:hypothetical protein
MSEDKFIWEEGGFRKDPYRLPDGYFTEFTGKMMDRVQHEAAVGPHPRRILRPWIAWISGAAAILVIGWMGIRAYYWKPLQEVRFQESIALMVDYYGEELHEGELAGFFEENKIMMKGQGTADMLEVIQIEPDMAEQYIYESIGF